MSVVALVVLVLVTWLARRTTQSPVLARLRVLFPAWRFFDRATASPQLYIRHADATGQLGAWRAVTAPAATPMRWAFAPRANVALAEQAAVEQLVAELGELDIEDDADAARDPRIIERVSYQIVGRIARAHAPTTAAHQWKIVVLDEDYIVSAVVDAPSRAANVAAREARA